ncbi:MAG TPA: hypothetical protein VD996_02670 [Chitinophagaceae bacterium]|nr:hypothetical protein [Chitinophagaceae bacterium]
MKQKGKTPKRTLPKKVIGALADAFDRSPLTIQRWVEKGDVRLTSDPAKKVFAEENIQLELN